MGKTRLIICALGASPPGTMGGNTKIAIEMARCLATALDVHVFLPHFKLPTFTKNIAGTTEKFSVCAGIKAFRHAGITFHTLTDYPKFDKTHPIGSTRWYSSQVRNLFSAINVGKDDFVFSCSDFHCDVLPIYPLQKKFGFKWIASVFLFVPFIFENLSKGYRFPAFKYVIYWFYQRILFSLMKRRAYAFVVTNKSDFKKFPSRFQNRLFAYYGGVNVEQIPDSGNRAIEHTGMPQVVFCSRLHPQKGIDSFLDVWKLVLDSLQSPAADIRPHLAVIGNGDPAYEKYLKNKADELGISKTITWLGYVNNEAKYQIYSSSKFLVHPTVFDNNGMVAAEALCTGLPVVMQDIPALRDVYTTGCVKVPFGDKKAFASAIVRLLSDSEFFRNSAPNSEQLSCLRSHWCWESRAEEFSKWLSLINV